jgi:hypothetical protein
MKKENVQLSSLIPLLLIVAVALLRVLFNTRPQLQLMANFSSIGAMAIFGGSRIKQPLVAILFPLITLLMSDSILSITVYKQFHQGFLYSGWYWVYGAFALMVFAGSKLLKTVTAMNILIACICITLIHWVVADLGVWLQGSLYPKNLAGWGACLVAAIPFERNFFAGSLLYSFVLFGGYAIIQKSDSRFRWV